MYNLRNNQSIILFLVLFFSTFFIYGFSHIGSIAYDFYNEGNQGFQEDTTVANINLSGKDLTNAHIIISEKIESWKQQSTVKISFKEKEYTLDNEKIYFDIDQTLKMLSEGEDISLIANISFEEAIINLTGQEKLEKLLDINKFKTDITKSVGNLVIGEYYFYLEDYLLPTANQELQLNQYSIRLSMEDEKSTTFKKSTFTIPKNAQFSLNEEIEKKGIVFSNVNIPNIIATSIYKVILPTNFVIVERNISNSIPDYAELGYEAEVNKDSGLDLKFYNPNAAEYKLDVQIISGELYVTLKGPSLLFTYKITSEGQQIFEPKKVIQYDPLIKNTSKIIEREGKNGGLIKIYREIYNNEGQRLSRELISEDFYPPIHTIEVRGLR
ncbi:MAG: hypothetical protein K0S34_666 [Bacillales bacterium]|jgi:hypothetical protein|nr:hypothetical protein [Bacillales bacterium]